MRYGARVTMYDAIGGQATVDAMVATLFARIAADDQLAGYYAASDPDRVQARYRHFFTTAFDGPGEWDGPLLAPAHAGRGINDAEYTRWCGHVLGALGEAGVHDSHRAGIAAEVLEPLRPHVVGQ